MDEQAEAALKIGDMRSSSCRGAWLSCKEAEPVKDAWRTCKVRVQHQSKQGVIWYHLLPTPSEVVIMGMLLGFCRLFEGASGTTKGPSSAWTAAESPKV